MKKKMVVFFLGFFLIGLVSANSHNANHVIITTSGHEMTLQEAVNNNFLSGNSPTQDYTTEADLIASGVAYHTGDEIYVSVDGSEGTLNSLVGSGLCGSGASSYSEEIVFGHSGDEIYLDNGKTLQEAINDGDYCCIDECSSAGITRCSTGDVRQTCGNYDSDSCLEWGNSYTCPGCKTCIGGGNCISNDDACGRNEECNSGVCEEFPWDCEYSFSPNTYWSLYYGTIVMWNNVRVHSSTNYDTAPFSNNGFDYKRGAYAGNSGKAYFWKVCRRPI